MHLADDAKTPGGIGVTVMPRLVLGLVPDDFDPSRDVAAGPWCFLNRSRDFDVWSRYPFPPDLRAKVASGDSASAYAECVALRDALLPELVEELNRDNGTAHRLDFWRELVDYWLITFVQVLYVARCTAEVLRANYGSQRLDVLLSPREVARGFRDTEQFVEAVYHDLDLFVWAISRFLEVSVPMAWTVRHDSSNDDAGSNGQGRAQASIKDTVRFVLRQLRARVAPRCFGVSGLGGWQAVIVSLLLAMKPRLPVRPPVEPADRLPPVAVPVLAPLDLGQVLELVRQVMPASFRNIALLPSLWWRHSPGKLRIVGNLVVVADSLKKAVALAREKGEFILGSQHGSSYGDQALPPTAIVEYRLDGFITWGWKAHPTYLANFVALPSPRLSRLRHRLAGADLVFVGIHIPLFYPRIEGTYGTTEVLGYVRNKVRFFESLNRLILDRVLYRPQRFSHAMDEVPYLRDRFPGLRLLDERPEGKLATCRLAVVDSPSTILFQALAANVPTIAFWNRTLWQMHAEAEALYDDLRRAGIVFEDPAAAAAKVNAVWDSVEEWWQGAAVQAARAKWCHEYARTSPNWFGEWLRTLWGLWSVKC